MHNKKSVKQAAAAAEGDILGHNKCMSTENKRNAFIFKLGKHSNKNTDCSGGTYALNKNANLNVT